MTDKLPPHNRETEASVLACMFSEPRLAEIAASDLSEDCFFDALHARVFLCISAIVGRGEPVDLPTVQREFAKFGLNPDILSRLFSESFGSIACFEQHVDALRDLTWRRRIRRAADDVSAAVGGDELHERISQFRAVSESSPVRDDARSVGELLEDPALMTPIERIKTGLSDLDAALCGGLAQGGFYILAATPGGGKSTIGRNVVRHSAHLGNHTLLVTLEDPVTLAARRIWSAEAHVAEAAIDSRMMGDRDVVELRHARERLKKLRLYISSGPNELSELEAFLRDQSRRGVKLVVLDQLSWVIASGDTALERTATISRRLRMVAHKLGITILMCVQFNREGCKRQGGATMFDLRDAGNLEQDADGVLIVKSLDETEAVSAPVTINLEVAKHRHGGMGSEQVVKLTWFKSEARVENYAPDMGSVEKPNQKTMRSVR